MENIPSGVQGGGYEDVLHSAVGKGEDEIWIQPKCPSRGKWGNLSAAVLCMWNRAQQLQGGCSLQTNCVWLWNIPARKEQVVYQCSVSALGQCVCVPFGKEETQNFKNRNLGTHVGTYTRKCIDKRL